ncbi:polysaccharide deacetylase family protein [Muricauda sp. CAU 1633]|uniref:polysaccharide deacetylase family protein n=1 Tax=Allomuricauda sp. CAU 1633 TaxID=2816036 RepID=UPI001A8DF441|nr:polysaccharide deacetylase family protein [Muricauda sp. CAU 1633]MBO0323975.1 polysaccharide deacetylase family protein [Muricauda sp. CAU 1633]
MKQLCILILSFLWIGTGLSAQKTLAKQLGYPSNAKLLIIHADDLGVLHTVNEATFKAFEVGSVKSASIMVPTPWLAGVAEYAKKNPEHDMGIHLTLTSEWKLLRWGPVAPRSKVSSLVDENGYLYPDCNQLWENAKIEEVEIELRAQIDKAIAMGINPTHLDSHMGCLFAQDSRYYQLYLKLAEEYGIPAMVNHQIAQLGGEGSPPPVVINQILGAGTTDYDTDMAAYYANALRKMTPGVHVMIIHCGYDNLESQGMSFEHPYWGAQWRQQDFDFFTSEECAKILKEENIHVVTWKEIGQLVKH